MRAVVLDAFGTVPALREVPEPLCPPDGAVVRVQGVRGRAVRSGRSGRVQLDTGADD